MFGPKENVVSVGCEDPGMSKGFCWRSFRLQGSPENSHWSLAYLHNRVLNFANSLKLVLILIAITLIAENISVGKIFLAAKEENTKSLKVARELLFNDFDIYVHVVVREIDNEINRVFNHFLPVGLAMSTIKSYIFMDLVWSNLLDSDKLKPEEKELLEEEVQKIFGAILAKDKSMRDLQRVFSRVSVNFEDPRFKVARLYPTWIIETEKGKVVLEGYAGDLLRFIDLKAKTLDLEKLQAVLK
jgi:hypothetical protein